MKRAFQPRGVLPPLHLVPLELVLGEGGTQLELEHGPCPSDVNFLPHVLRELLASLHVITGSVPGLGSVSWFSAPQPLCSVGPASHSRRSVAHLSSGETGAPTETSPHSFGLQTPRRRLGVWCWEKQWRENMLMASLRPDIPLLASRKTLSVWLLMEGSLSSDGLPAHHPDHPPRPASHGGAWCGWRGSAVRQAARLPRRRHAEVAETCVQTGSA